MLELMEFAVRGLLLGVTYGILALPISLLFLTTDSVDLSVGAYAVLAGAVVLLVGGVAGLFLGVIAAVIASGLVAAVALKLNRPDKQNPIVAVLATFGAATALESFVLTVYGKNPIVARPFENLWEIAGMRFSPQMGINVAIGLLVLLALSAVLYMTPFGRAMRACSVNPIGASLAGIPVRRIWSATYIMGGLLAGLAGVLILYSSGMDYAQGLNLTLSAFGAAILFGLTSPLRAFVGGLVMGLVQALSTGYLPGAWATAMPLAFIFVMLSTGRLNRAAIAGGRA